MTLVFDSPKPEEIREARRRAGLTQSEAAAMLGKHRITWTRYEIGQSQMSPIEWDWWKSKVKKASK